LGTRQLDSSLLGTGVGKFLHEERRDVFANILHMTAVARRDT
jgi:hypothetical protein